MKTEEQRRDEELKVTLMTTIVHCLGAHTHTHTLRVTSLTCTTVLGSDPVGCGMW